VGESCLRRSNVLTAILSSRNSSTDIASQGRVLRCELLDWDYRSLMGMSQPRHGQPSKRCSLYLWTSNGWRALTPDTPCCRRALPPVSRRVYVRNALAQSHDMVFSIARDAKSASSYALAVLPTLNDSFGGARSRGCDIPMKRSDNPKSKSSQRSTRPCEAMSVLEFADDKIAGKHVAASQTRLPTAHPRRGRASLAPDGAWN